MQLNWTGLIELTEVGVSRIRQIAGVYRLSYLDPKDQSKYVYYVGQAVNLKTRLSDHLPKNEAKACCKHYLENYSCYFKAAAISSQADRDSAERALYDHFNPSCPEKIPDVEPLAINFD